MSFATDEPKPKLEELDPKVVIPFYHGRISSDVAEERLKRHGEEGGYLFRESDTKIGVFILSSITKGSVSHTLIPQNGKWRQTYNEAVVKMEDLVNLAVDYCTPVTFDLSIHKIPFKKLFVKSESSILLCACSCCNYKAESKNDLDNHLRNHHKVKKCFNCMKYFRYNIYRFHEKVCNNKTPKDLGQSFQCDICKFKTFHESSLTRHRKAHSSKPYLCEACHSCFKSEKRLRFHQCGPEMKFKCKNCDKKFTSSSSVHRHMKTNHTVEKKERSKGRTYYKCDQCLYQTHIKERLERHKNNKHTEQKKIIHIHECEHCDYRTPVPSRMRRHRLTCKQGATKAIIVSIIGEETICMK